MGHAQVIDRPVAYEHMIEPARAKAPYPDRAVERQAEYRRVEDEEAAPGACEADAAVSRMMR